MKIIVTGSAGFIGSHLVKALKERGDVVLEIDLKDGNDLNDQLTLDWIVEKIPEADCIVNLAGTCSTPRGFTYPDEAFKNNTLATYNVMQLARKLECHVIHVSSIKAQEKFNHQTGMNDGYTPYGLTKKMGEMIALEWSQTYNVPVTVLRPGTIYGIGQHGSAESGWIAWFIKCLLTGQTIEIHGDGLQVRDPLYVDDFVSLLIQEIEEKGEIKCSTALEVGGKTDTTILEMVQYMSTLVPATFRFVSERPGDIKNLTSSCKVGSKRLEYGIKETIEYYQEHKELL